MTSSPDTPRIVARNKKARFDFEILEEAEAGLVLLGTEVKSLRAGKATLTGGFVRIRDGEAFLIGVQIPEYSHGTCSNHDPLRPRKLLLHRRELRRIHQTVKTQGVTIVPLELYFLGARVKVKIGLARGKRKHDKRQALAQRESRREVSRALRRRY